MSTSLTELIWNKVTLYHCHVQCSHMQFERAKLLLNSLAANGVFALMPYNFRISVCVRIDNNRNKSSRFSRMTVQINLRWLRFVGLSIQSSFSPSYMQDLRLTYVCVFFFFPLLFALCCDIFSVLFCYFGSTVLQLRTYKANKSF